MRCLVIGAGLLGLTTAWFLRQHGFEVTVVERRGAPGEETSFANGGMLHASQASPWNEPGVLWQVLKTLGREDSALLIRARALPHMMPWAWSFFRNSRRAAYVENLEKNARLADYSLAVMNEHFRALPMSFDRADRGTLKIYRSPAELEVAREVALRCRDWNVSYNVLDASAVVELEPALTPIGDQLSGGIHFPDDLSGDAQRFCVELASACTSAGVQFEYNATVEKLLSERGRCHAACIDGELRYFDACVIAAGSYSGALARSLGVKVPVQPVKGYSLTLPLEAWPVVPQVPVIDEHFHAALCPLGKRMRVAGTAEFAGFDTSLTRSRIENLYSLVAGVYPQAAVALKHDKTIEWAGLRPMSPDGVGIMGPTRVAGLYLNTGHGHLGWTMAPGAGKLVADCVAGQGGEIPLDDYQLTRF